MSYVWPMARTVGVCAVRKRATRDEDVVAERPGRELAVLADPRLIDLKFMEVRILSQERVTQASLTTSPWRPWARTSATMRAVSST